MVSIEGMKEDLVGGANSPLNIMIEEEDKQTTLDRIVDNSSPMLQAALPHILDGCSPGEVAKILGVHPVSIRRATSKVRQVLSLKATNGLKSKVVRISEDGITTVFDSLAAAALATGTPVSAISQAINGHRHRAGGCRWRRAGRAE